MSTWEHTFGAMQYYKLDETRTPIPCTQEEYIEWMKDGHKGRTERRRIAWDEVENYKISTVFLMIDHNFWGVGDPLLFETMIFGPEEPPDQSQWRYTTYEDALQGHHRAVTYVERYLHAKRIGLPPPPTPALDHTSETLDQRAMDAYLDDVLNRAEPLGLYSGEARQEPSDLLDLEPRGHDRDEDPELP